MLQERNDLFIERIMVQRSFDELIRQAPLAFRPLLCEVKVCVLRRRVRVHVYVCMYVCMYVCISMCVYVCVCICVSVFVCVCMEILLSLR